MKKILKNNQVIITALAIMIAIAGYLNYVQKIGDENDYQSVISGDINNIDKNLFDISEEDIFAENQAADKLQEGKGQRCFREVRKTYRIRMALLI